MISRQETDRAMLNPGEVDASCRERTEIVLVAGTR